MWLGIDTSGAVSVALSAAPAEGTGTGDLRVLAVASDDRARHHDEVLMGLVDRVLGEAGARRSDLTAVVAGRGPGPFTGLRVGLVTARTLAATLDIELMGLCSLDALAEQAAALDEHARAGSQRPLRIAVAADARRREVYWARYELTGADGDAELRRIAGPAVDAPADVAEELTSDDVLVGSGCALYPELLPETADIPHVDAGYLLRAAARRRALGEDLSSTAPLYLREPDAARPTARKSALGLRP